MRDRDGQQSAQGGSLHTPTTDHNTQLITAHAHDHHSSYSSRARVAIAMRLMFSGASSNHLVFAASTGAVSGPNGVPLEGAQYSGSPCQSSSRDSIVRHVACLADWFLRVSLRAQLVRGFQHGVGWQPGPTQRLLQPSRGHWIRRPRWSPSAAASTRAQRSRGHLDPLDYLREVTQHRGVLV